jgi:hypothetical protein
MIRREWEDDGGYCGAIMVASQVWKNRWKASLAVFGAETFIEKRRSWLMMISASSDMK